MDYSDKDLDFRHYCITPTSCSNLDTSSFPTPLLHHLNILLVQRHRIFRPRHQLPQHLRVARPTPLQTLSIQHNGNLHLRHARKALGAGALQLICKPLIALTHGNCFVLRVCQRGLGELEVRVCGVGWGWGVGAEGLEGLEAGERLGLGCSEEVKLAVDVERACEGRGGVVPLQFLLLDEHVFLDAAD